MTERDYAALEAQENLQGYADSQKAKLKKLEERIVALEKHIESLQEEFDVHELSLIAHGRGYFDE